MKNHSKTHTGAEGKEHHEAKDEKSAAHVHAHDKTDKQQPVDAETDKPVEKTADDPVAAKIAGLEDRHLRLLADFDNYRKRSMKDRESASRLVRENMLMEFLPVIDNIELGMNAALAHKMDKVFVDGYRMIADQLAVALAKFGLKPQEAQGLQFDANVHEAIQMVQSDEHPAGTVVTVVRKGYQSGEVVLRPAQVIVSSGPAVPVGDEKPAESTGQAADESAKPVAE
ncbi:MAG: nucleotide exchange factor GrpE [bacterium]